MVIKMGYKLILVFSENDNPVASLVSVIDFTAFFFSNLMYKYSVFTVSKRIMLIVSILVQNG